MESADAFLILRFWPELADYAVQAGDSLFTISLEFGTTVEAIAALNAIGEDAPLRVGDVLRIAVGFSLALGDPDES